MKTYKSHKTVEAAKIERVQADPASGIILHLTDGTSATVSANWYAKQADGGDKELRGGYLVRYADGYTSWSPADAFEEGYTEHSLDPKDGALPVAGYKPQTSAKVDLVNENKALEEHALRQLDRLKDSPDVDGRWLAIGRTHLEQAWMAINRAVFQPGRAKLPGDDALAA